MFFLFISNEQTQYWTISSIFGKPGTCLNFIIGNNIDRTSHRKQGMRSIWDLLPQRDKTARIKPHNFLSFLRGESHRYWSNLKIEYIWEYFNKLILRFYQIHIGLSKYHGC